MFAYRSKHVRARGGPVHAMPRQGVLHAGLKKNHQQSVLIAASHGSVMYIHILLYFVDLRRGTLGLL